MEFRTQINNYLMLDDFDGKIDNQQILIVAKSGHGKGLSAEGIMEKFHNAGYLVLCVSDPKKEWELAFSMFKPKSKYHLRHLRKIGKIPSTIPVRLYHPFSFNIPKDYLPNINFFTFSLKEFQREEWSTIVEAESDTESVGILLNTSNNITKEDGLHSFLHNIESSLSSKSSKSKRDPKNFLLQVPPGTRKSISEISRKLQPFQKNYFLAKDNGALNLNWKELLQDQKNLHVFSTYWLDDEKLDDLVVLALLNGIIRNKKYKKHPILIMLPEISRQCPPNPKGYKIMLSKTIRNLLKTIRNITKGGCSSVVDSQDLTGIDDEIRKTSTEIFLGEVGADNERVAKVFNYGKRLREQLRNMGESDNHGDGRNKYIWVGHEEDLLTLFFSSAGHKEQGDDFFDSYKKEYSKDMKNYNNLKEQMKKSYLDDENKVREKVKRIDKEEKEKIEKEKREKEKSKSDDSKEDKKSSRIKEIEAKNRLDKMKLCYEMKNDPKLNEKEKSFRKIALKYGLTHDTVKKYIQEYEKIGDEDGNK